MYYMFGGCLSLTEINLSNFDTSKVKSMERMFYGCTSLTKLTMTGDVSNVTYVSDMFYGITTNGTFYYNPDYDYSRIISVLPATWKAVPLK
jgi:surface protein